MTDWCRFNQTDTVFIQTDTVFIDPGSSWQNACGPTVSNNGG